MAIKNFVYRSTIQKPAEDLYSWHTRKGAFHRLAAPWIKMRLDTPHPGVFDGALVKFTSFIGPIPCKWCIEHCMCEKNKKLKDIMVHGPLKHWEHEHIFKNQGNSTLYEDSIDYELPFSTISHPLVGSKFEKMLHRLFHYRHEIVQCDLTLPWFKQKPEKPLKILVTGANGLIGAALIPYLQTQGHTVIALSHSREKSPLADESYEWRPLKKRIPLVKLEGLDAVVHLSGEPIFQRWTFANRARIWKSRVQSTRFLCESLARLKNPPKVVIAASAMGYYGPKSSGAPCDENSPIGRGFLAELCEAWEYACFPLAQLGIRVVHLRSGAVLSPEGGALKNMLFPYNFKVGVTVGPSTNALSWISRDDLLDIIYFSIINQAVNGPVNAVAPTNTTNKHLAEILDKYNHPLMHLKIPDNLIKAVLGQFAEEVLFSNLSVKPQKLLDAGFTFRYSTIDDYFKLLYI